MDNVALLPEYFKRGKGIRPTFRTRGEPQMTSIHEEQLGVASLLRFLRLIGGGVKVCTVMADVLRGQDLLSAGSMDVSRFEGEAGEAQ